MLDGFTYCTLVRLVRSLSQTSQLVLSQSRLTPADCKSERRRKKATTPAYITDTIAVYCSWILWPRQRNVVRLVHKKTKKKKGKRECLGGIQDVRWKEGRGSGAGLINPLAAAADFSGTRLTHEANGFSNERKLWVLISQFLRSSTSLHAVEDNHHR